MYMPYGDARFLGPGDTTSLTKRQLILEAAKKDDYNSKAIVDNAIDERICASDIGGRRCEDMPSGEKGCNQYFYVENGVGYTCRNNSAGTKCKSGSNSFFGTSKMTCKKKVGAVTSQRGLLRANARPMLYEKIGDEYEYRAPVRHAWEDDIEAIGDAPDHEGGKKSRKKKRGKGRKRTTRKRTARKRTARKKHRRPKGRGLMQSRPRDANEPPRAQAAAQHRRRHPPKETLHGKVPGHMEGDLAALGVTAYGAAVSTHNPRMMAAEDRGIEESARRGLGKHRRGPADSGETQKAFTGLARTSSGSSDSSIGSRSPAHHPGRIRRAWNPLDSYGESPPAKSTRHSATRKRGGRRTRKRQKGGNPVVRTIGTGDNAEDILVYQRLSNDPDSDDYHRLAHPAVEGWGYVQIYDADGNEDGYSYMRWHPTAGWYDGNAQVIEDDFEFFSDDESPTSVLDMNSHGGRRSSS